MHDVTIKLRKLLRNGENEELFQTVECRIQKIKFVFNDRIRVDNSSKAGEILLQFCTFTFQFDILRTEEISRFIS